MYVASYMMKNERGMCEWLKDVGRESRSDDSVKQLRRLGSAFLHKREVRAQEATYRLLSIPMKKLSRSVVFLNTNVAKERISVIKPLQHLEMMHDEDEDVFQKSMIDCYIHRPPELERICFAEFGANYTVVYKEESQDSLPLINDEDTSTSCKIKLMDNFGVMHKRTREAIIRFHQPNKEKNPNDFFRTKLMSYLPWRNENADLLSPRRVHGLHFSLPKLPGGCHRK